VKSSRSKRLRLADLSAEIPAYRETIRRMVSVVGLQSADACHSQALLEYMCTTLRPAVLHLQTQRVAEQARLLEELVVARAVLAKPEHLTDLAADSWPPVRLVQCAVESDPAHHLHIQRRRLAGRRPTVLPRMERVRVPGHGLDVPVKRCGG
jgi:hypothetical protein